MEGTIFVRLQEIVDASEYWDGQKRLTAFRRIDRDALHLIGHIEFLGNVEKEFGILIPDGDWENLVTVQDLIEYLERQGVKEPETTG